MFHLAASQEVLHASLLSIAEASAISRPTDPLAVAIHTYPLIPASPPFPLLAKAPVSVVPGQSFTINPHVLSACNVAYSKSLTLLRREIGPHFDLEKIWGEHIQYVRMLVNGITKEQVFTSPHPQEFAERDALSQRTCKSPLFIIC